VADAPAIMHAVQRLLSSSQASPHVAAAALQVVEALATGLASAEAASEGCRSLAVGPWALQLLCCCAPKLNDPSTLHPALAAATALVCVLAPAEQNPAIACSRAAGRALAPLLAALTTALQANLVGEGATDSSRKRRVSVTQACYAQQTALPSPRRHCIAVPPHRLTGFPPLPPPQLLAAARWHSAPALVWHRQPTGSSGSMCWCSGPTPAACCGCW
jgi:hypothetical protein